jgi:hypothetical protein
MEKLKLIEKGGKHFRICRKCEKELETYNFDKCSKTKCGFRSVCKLCRKDERVKNQEVIKTKRKLHYELNKTNILLSVKKYREENKDKVLLSAKKYREENKDKVAISKRKSTKKRYSTDGFFRVTTQLRKYVKRYFDIKTKPKKTMDIVGCKPNELKDRFELLFEKWMSWDNYGYGEGKWVIDHIIPLSSAKNINELHSLCHYTNLQPLSWEENMVKGNKLNYK